jgi:hypothetical protein
MKEDFIMIKKILDYKLAEDSKAVFNTDASQMTPGMVKMWKKLKDSLDG